MTDDERQHFRGSVQLVVLLSSVAGVVAVVAVVFAILGWARINNSDTRRAELAVSTTQALCSFKEDLQKRIATTQDFLLKNPQGIPGIPLATLQQSLANQQSTIVSLKELRCPE